MVMESCSDPNKRLRRVPVPMVSSSSSSAQKLDPIVADDDQKHVDMIISSFLSLSVSPSSLSSSPFERAIDQMLETYGAESVNLDRGIELVALVHEATKRCARKRATIENSVTWPIPTELTMKVFSMVDTKSLVRTSASCTMFKKLATEPFCYSNVDMTTANVKSQVVRDMILNKAGNELRSLKAGCPDRAVNSLLTRHFLAPLSYKKHGVPGNLLESLHLYNHGLLDGKSLCGPLSVCSNLTDLKIVGLKIDTLPQVVELLTTKCQHLFFQRYKPGGWNYVDASPFQRNCPNLTSLSLIGFDIADHEVYMLLLGLRKLKYIDLSDTLGFEGRFLRDVTVNHDFKDAVIETLILRDSIMLRKRMVCQFMNSLLTAGHLKFIKHIDVSNDDGLRTGNRRCKKPKFPLEELKVARPGLTFVANFPTLPSESSSSSSDSSPSSSMETMIRL